MELQAVRYAAMVSTMTFEKAVEIYREYLLGIKSEIDASKDLLKFLDWAEPDEELFAQDVRIVLVSAEFSKEITTSVLWLNNYGLDIQCIRVKPYSHDGRILIDVEKIIPLPEASEYQERVSAKTQKIRSERNPPKDYTKFDVAAGQITEKNLPKRYAIFFIVKHLCENGIEPEIIAELIHWRKNCIFYSVDGIVSSEDFIAKAIRVSAEDKRAFDEQRWFCGEDELIKSNGRTYAFSNQWGTKTRAAMNILVNSFPQEKISFKESDL